MDNIQKKVNKISGDIEIYDEIKSGPISKISVSYTHLTLPTILLV